MHSAFPYAFGQVVIELPNTLIQIIIYAVIVYAMVGFEWTFSKLFWYLFFMYFTFLYYTLYDMMIMAITPNTSISPVVSSAFYPLWNIFFGFIILITRIGIWWRWFYYWVCPASWTLYGLVCSQFGDFTGTLDSGETLEDFIRDILVTEEFLGVVGKVVLFTHIFLPPSGAKMGAMEFVDPTKFVG